MKKSDLGIGGRVSQNSTFAFNFRVAADARVENISLNYFSGGTRHSEDQCGS
jgi:hypothetical protein